MFVCISMLYAKTTPIISNDSITLQKANNALDTQPNVSFRLYNQLLKKHKENKEYKKMIACHIGISDVYKNKNLYYKAYNHLWDALLISEKIKDTFSLMIVNRDLGRLYNIYEKHTDALKHFNTSLKFIRKNKELQSHSTNIYYSIAITYGRAKEYKKAITYLDSCTYFNSINKKRLLDDNAYVTVEKGYIFLKTDQLKKAKIYLEKGHHFFDKQQGKYRIISALYLGDLYAKERKWRKANKYYKYSLQVLNKSIAHRDKKVEVLKKLSFTYKKIGDLSKAYTYLNNSKAISDSLFNIKKAVNSDLFKMNNRYEKTIDIKNKLIKNQNDIIEKKNIIQSRLKLILFFIIFVVISLIIFVLMKRKLKKMSYETEQQEKKNRYEREKNSEIMEFKSRELTVNALKLIEKDNNIKELLEELKEVAPDKHKEIKHRILKGNKNMWEDFNKRFIEVNTSFYNHLRKKHSDLTPTEEKHCALMKLNFDSKEMASILNITLSSVHISRHRIRKKMGLKRDDNLNSYIANL